MSVTTIVLIHLEKRDWFVTYKSSANITLVRLVCLLNGELSGIAHEVQSISGSRWLRQVRGSCWSDFRSLLRCGSR